MEIFEGSCILLHSIPAPIFEQSDDLNIHYYTVLQTARAVLQWELCVVFYLGSSWLKAIAFVVSRWHQLQNQLCTLEEELHHQGLDSAES